MIRNLLLTCSLSFAFAVAGNAQAPASSSETGAHYTGAQLKKLVHNSHTPAQYAVLARHYGERQADYLRQAAEEKKEWDRMSQNVMGAAAKYPRPSDSARNLYEYYRFKASEAGTLEAKYSRLTAPDASVNAQ